LRLQVVFLLLSRWPRVRLRSDGSVHIARLESDCSNPVVASTLPTSFSSSPVFFCLKSDRDQMVVSTSLVSTLESDHSNPVVASTLPTSFSSPIPPLFFIFILSSQVRPRSGGSVHIARLDSRVRPQQSGGSVHIARVVFQSPLFSAHYCLVIARHWLSSFAVVALSFDIAPSCPQRCKASQDRERTPSASRKPSTLTGLTPIIPAFKFQPLPLISQRSTTPLPRAIRHSSVPCLPRLCPALSFSTATSSTSKEPTIPVSPPRHSRPRLSPLACVPSPIASPSSSDLRGDPC
jgi:hypothetical protein